MTRKVAVAVSILGFIAFGVLNAHAEAKLMNVSYDPTRELYTEFNAAFSSYWQKLHGEPVSVTQSHGGSGKQARSVIDGLEADVVTLALAWDIDEISRISGLLAENWQERLADNSTPYTSTVVFLVRKGNPKAIKDWSDLVRDDVKVITPNPKTSGGARWNYLAAWAFAAEKFKGDEKQVRTFISQILANVPVLDTGARGATTTFVQRGIGDVLLAWENEALLARDEMGADKFEIVYPSLSILAEPPVAWVEKNTAKHATQDLAKEYLQYLYSEEGQRIIAKHHFRPRMPSVQKEFSSKFPTLRMVTVEQVSGSWKKAQEVHFAEGASFDELYLAKRE